mmetsp:Transcript_2722/g.7709  ORF Transcript_2722/g.7709 Transcript_2722/m.7709 type:complete len:404 (+) Transcript_2722:189-1400(+)
MQQPHSKAQDPSMTRSPSAMGATTTAPWASGGGAQAPNSAPWAAGGGGGAMQAAPWAQAAADSINSRGRPDTPVISTPPGQAKVAPPNIVDASPSLPAVAANLAGHTFLPPQKTISSQDLLRQFLDSESLKEYVSFLMACSEAVKGKKLSADCTISPVMERMQEELRRLSAMVDDIPPLKVELRFGNPAYRDWFAKMEADSTAVITRILPDNMQGAAAELAGYWSESFGNIVRIDYGTGHETSFVVLLFCMAKIGAITGDCLQAMVSRVFVEYLNLMRKLQTTYWLEPAGSHGVWGLDDYQFLPFYWGAAQLIGHPYIKPKSIHNEEILEGFSAEYLYLGCVTFVKQVKKGNLSETSPMLNDISGVPNWGKVNSGMMKMYQAEVLSKLPIMQHLLFGSLLSFP